jgi:hypothetical protein
MSLSSFLKILCWLVGAGCFPDNLDKAIAVREKFDYASVAAWRPSRMTESEFHEIRMQNARIGLDEAPTIGEIVEVDTMKTDDGGDLTVSVRTVDGREYTLWAVGNEDAVPSHQLRWLPVRSITNY